MNLFQYGRSLILQIGDGLGEISPLPGLSQESLEEARSELIHCFNTGKEPKFPSVRWGLTCASKPYDPSPLTLPLSALHKPFPGATHLKLKLGALPVTQAVEKAQRHMGRYRLRIDCNRAWSLQEALWFCSHFSPDDFDYLEEPVRDFEDLVRFSEITQFPLAVDESARENLPIEHIASLKYVVVKPMLTGSIPKFHVPVILSSSYETSIGLVHIAQHASPHLAHGLHTFCDDLISPPLKAYDGALHVAHHAIAWEKLCLIDSRP